MKKEIPHFNLDQPLENNLVKKLDDKALYVLIDDIRNNIIKHTSINGGHLSSNLGVVEITVALHKYFSLPEDKIIFDVGHQCYTHKILSGRPITNLRHADGVSGFPKKDESIYDCYETGHSSTSISAAMGLALARDLKGEKGEVIALIGDSSFTNGLSLEAMNLLSTFPHKIIIIINDNNRAISASRGNISKHFENMRISPSYINFKKGMKKLFLHKYTSFIYKGLKGFKNFFKYHTLDKNNYLSSFNVPVLSHIDGHDLSSLSSAFKKAKKAKSSIILHITTKKGKGYKYASEDKIGSYHGVEPFNVEKGLENSVIKEAISWSDVYANLVKQGLEKDEKMVVVNPATTVGSKLNDIFDQYPSRCIDVGIAEEHATILASGIATNGYKPYLSIYSTFLQRCYDQISHDVARMNLDVTFLIDRVGLPNSDGETHQGIFDVAFLNSIPNMTIAMAKDANEAEALFNFSLSYDKPFAIRYPRGATNVIPHKNIEIKLGQWIKEKDGEDVAIISYGPIVNDLIKEIEDTTIINALFIRPIDIEMVKSNLHHKHIVIYDIYGTKEGFAHSLISELISLGYKGKITVLAIDNTFIKHGTINDQLKQLKLDIDTLKQTIRDLKSGN